MAKMIIRITIRIIDPVAAWALAIVGGNQIDPSKMVEACRQAGIAVKGLYDALADVVVQRRAEGSQGDDVVGRLLRAEYEGRTLVDALEISATVVANLAIRHRMLDVARTVREGATLARGLERSGDIPPMMLHLIASGERAGELDSMLARAAEQQEKTLAARIALVVSLFEPIMLVLMGGVVLLIVMAILLPILSLNQLVN